MQARPGNVLSSPGAQPVFQITLSPALWNLSIQKPLEEERFQRERKGWGRSACFSVLSAIPALWHGLHFLTPTFPSYRHPTPLLGSEPNLSCPVTPTRCYGVEGGAQCQGFIRANEGSALQMPVQDTGGYRTAHSPHHNLGHSVPSSLSLAEESRATPSEEREI